MLRISKGSKQPVRVEIEVEGQAIEVEVAPWTDQDETDYVQKYARAKYVYNPESKRMQEIFRVDPAQVPEMYKDKVGRILKNFWGVGDEDGNALDGTLIEHRLLFAGIEVAAPVTAEKTAVCPECGAAHAITIEVQGRRTVFDLVMDKARAAGAARMVQAGERAKNS